MKKPNKILLLRYKICHTISIIRQLKWKALGMKIDSGGTLGVIKCTSPNAVTIGKKCEIRDGVIFWIKNPFDTINNHIIIGNHSFVGFNTEFNCSHKIIIGNNCLISSCVIFVDSSHIFADSNYINSQGIESQSIVIEDDVWIGSSCIILRGVIVGKGAIVGANSLVNKSIPNNEIWAGSPAVKIGERK